MVNEVKWRRWLGCYFQWGLCMCATQTCFWTEAARGRAHTHTFHTFICEWTLRQTMTSDLGNVFEVHEASSLMLSAVDKLFQLWAHSGFVEISGKRSSMARSCLNSWDEGNQRITLSSVFYRYTFSAPLHTHTHTFVYTNTGHVCSFPLPQAYWVNMQHARS